MHGIFLCEEKLKIEGDSIIVMDCTPGRWYSSISMTKWIRPSTGIHAWKFKVDNIKSSWHVIGIWKCDKKFTDVYENGYGYIISAGYLTNPRDYGNLGKGYGTVVRDDWVERRYKCKNGDLIEMIVDMDKLSISYKVNDKDFGVAFEEIDETEYRAGITTCYRDSRYTFISYTNSRLLLSKR